MVVPAEQSAGDAECPFPVPDFQPNTTGRASEGRFDEIPRHGLTIDQTRQQSLDTGLAQSLVHTRTIGGLGNIARRWRTDEFPILAELLMPREPLVPGFDAVEEFGAAELPIKTMDRRPGVAESSAMTMMLAEGGRRDRYPAIFSLRARAYVCPISPS